MRLGVASWVALAAGLPVCLADALPGDLYRDVEALAKARRRGDHVTVVDVRDRGAFDRVHIPGSMNLSLHELKARPYLGRRDVILVDEGSGTRDLARTAARLRSEGFERLHLLAGGLNAWASAGMALTGTAPHAAATRLVPPHALLGEDLLSAWIVLDAGPGVAAQEDLATLLDGVEVLRNPSTLERSVRRRAAEDAAPVRILFVTDDGTGYDGARTELPTDLPGVIFVLDGGWEALGRAAGQVAALQARHSITVSSPSRTDAPARLNSQPCGGCP